MGVPGERSIRVGLRSVLETFTPPFCGCFPCSLPLPCSFCPFLPTMHMHPRGGRGLFVCIYFGRIFRKQKPSPSDFCDLPAPFSHCNILFACPALFRGRLYAYFCVLLLLLLALSPIFSHSPTNMSSLCRKQQMRSFSFPLQETTGDVRGVGWEDCRNTLLCFVIDC